MLPAALAPIAAVVTQVGGRLAASAVGQALVGTPLRALLTGLGVGQAVAQHAPQAQAQVQQHRS